MPTLRSLETLESEGLLSPDPRLGRLTINTFLKAR